MTQFLLLTIAIVVYGSLYPFHFEITARAATPLLTVWYGWPAEWNRFMLRDVLLNVVLYSPLGFAAAMLSLRRHSRVFSAAAAIALAFALSTSMEILQVYEPVRDPSSLDVLSNAVGAALGAAVALLCGRALLNLTALRTRAFRAASVILLAVWAIYQFYPLFPDIGRTHLYQNLYGLLRTRNLPLVETWLGVAEWFAAGLALELVFARLRTAWLACLMLVSFAGQMSIADRNLTASEVVAAAVALALWQVSNKKARATWCAWLLGAAILLRELQPFYLLSVPQPFSWIPFAATLESQRSGAVIVIARKAFDYGAMVFALRCAGWKYWRAGLSIAGALALAEALQTYLPGRTPEITDSLLALLMTAVMMWATPRKAER